MAPFLFRAQLPRDGRRFLARALCPHAGGGRCGGLAQRLHWGQRFRSEAVCRHGFSLKSAADCALFSLVSLVNGAKAASSSGECEKEEEIRAPFCSACVLVTRGVVPFYALYSLYRRGPPAEPLGSRLGPFPPSRELCVCRSNARTAHSSALGSADILQPRSFERPGRWEVAQIGRAA